VGGLQKLQSTVFHKGNATSVEFEFELRAVARASKQHRLRLQREAVLALLEHALRYIAGLIGGVADGDELWLPRRDPVGPEILRMALRRQADHRVGGIEDRLRGSVIAVQGNHPREWREPARKVEDVAHGRGAKGVDRLRVVADHRHALAVRLHPQENRRLQAVGVLVLVDEHVIEARANFPTQAGVRNHDRPVQQQVVVVEDVLRLLRFDIGIEELLELRLPLGAPGIGAL